MVNKDGTEVTLPTMAWINEQTNSGFHVIKNILEYPLGSRRNDLWVLTKDLDEEELSFLEAAAALEVASAKCCWESGSETLFSKFIEPGKFVAYQRIEFTLESVVEFTSSVSHRFNRTERHGPSGPPDYDYDIFERKVFTNLYDRYEHSYHYTEKQYDVEQERPED